MIWSSRFFATLALGAVLLQACTSTRKKENDWEKLRLNQKVKTMTEISYAAKVTATGIEKGQRERAPSDFDNDKVVNFNHKGMKVKERILLSNDSLLFAISYHYDAKGLLTEIIRRSPESPLDMRLVYQYNDKGEPIKQISYNEEGKENYYLDYFFNAKGNQVKKEWFQHSKTPDFTWRYEYDQHDNLVKVSWLEPDGSVKRIQKYQYDHKNRLILQTTEMTGRDFLFKRNYIYKNGRLVEETWSQGDNIKHAYRYAYNDAGSEIQRVEYANETPIYIVERVLQLYTDETF